MIVEFLYGCNCGNTEIARKNLTEAFLQLGIQPNWKEIDIDSPQTPEVYHQYGSPTILLNGKDILPGDQNSSGGT